MTRCDRCGRKSVDVTRGEEAWPTLRIEGPFGWLAEVEVCWECGKLVADLDPVRLLECLRRIYR